MKFINFFNSPINFFNSPLNYAKYQSARHRQNPQVAIFGRVRPSGIRKNLAIKKICGSQYMQSERRDLEYFGKGLSDSQIVEKKRMLKESAEFFPEIAVYEALPDATGERHRGV